MRAKALDGAHEHDIAATDCLYRVLWYGDGIGPGPVSAAGKDARLKHLPRREQPATRPWRDQHLRLPTLRIDEAGRCTHTALYASPIGKGELNSVTRLDPLGASGGDICFDLETGRVCDAKQLGFRLDEGTQRGWGGDNAARDWARDRYRPLIASDAHGAGGGRSGPRLGTGNGKVCLSCLVVRTCGDALSKQSFLPRGLAGGERHASRGRCAAGGDGGGVAAFDQCVDSGKGTARVRKDVADSGTAGARGTPTFYVGLTEPNSSQLKAVRVIRGAQPYSSFKDAIDSLLASAK